MNTDATYVEIIHLSDLHYGEGHIFNPGKTADGKAAAGLGMPTLADKLIEDLTNPNEEPSRPEIGESIATSNAPDFVVPRIPKIVCLSGDFTQRPRWPNSSKPKRLCGGCGKPSR